MFDLLNDDSKLQLNIREDPATGLCDFPSIDNPGWRKKIFLPVSRHPLLQLKLFTKCPLFSYIKAWAEPEGVRGLPQSL